MDYSVVTTSEGVLVAALIKVKTTKRSKKSLIKTLENSNYKPCICFQKFTRTNNVMGRIFQITHLISNMKISKTIFLGAIQ